MTTELPILTRLRNVAEKQRIERGGDYTLGNPDPWLTEAADLITELVDALRTASWLLADISPDGLVKAKVDAALAKATETPEVETP